VLLFLSRISMVCSEIVEAVMSMVAVVVAHHVEGELSYFFSVLFSEISS